MTVLVNVTTSRHVSKLLQEKERNNQCLQSEKEKSEQMISRAQSESAHAQAALKMELTSVIQRLHVNKYTYPIMVHSYLPHPYI